MWLLSRRMSFVARPGRIDLRVPVVLDFGDERITAETCNVGLGGLFVATPELVPVGQLVSLRLALPRLDEPLLVNAEVRWARPNDDGRHHDCVPGVGVRFVRLPLYVAAALNNFVRSHAPGT